MISYLLVFLYYILALCLFFIVFREVISLSYLYYYRMQGIKIDYFPIIGFNRLFIKRKGSKDQVQALKKFIKFHANNNEDLVACNSNKTLENAVLVLNPDLIKELYAKELKYTIKFPILTRVNFGFFWKNGKEAIKHRTTFGQFFKIENLKLLTPSIQKLTDDYFRELRQNLWGNTKNPDWVKIDFKSELTNLFSRFISEIVFKEKTNPKVDGVPLPIAIGNYLSYAFKQIISPVNLLTCDKLHNLGILPSTKKMAKMQNKIEDACFNMYLKRLKEGPKKGGVNMLDLMIQQNQDSGNKTLNKEEIAGHFILLQFAGMDTSKEVVTRFLHFLSKKTDLQNQIRNNLQSSIWKGDLQNFELYDSNEEYNQTIQEALRLYVPFNTINPRKAIKNFKLGKYTILKGTNLIYSVGCLHLVDKHHQNPEKFDASRFSSENRKKMNKITHIPFSSGKRNCIGQYMGELMIKMMVSSILKNFEVKEVEDYNPPLIMELAYGIKDCWVYLKPR